MNNEKLYSLSTIIKVPCVLLFLVANIGCFYDLLSITGKVVDESGSALSEVSVWACYSGWGWSEGRLVWDKNYCSETVQTNHEGMYVIRFKGPASSRLRAKKEDWVQTQDFNTIHSRIILVKSAEYRARLKSETQLYEKEQRQRLSHESEIEYYCRVILSEIRSIRLNYQGEALSITPNLLKINGKGGALFALRGSSRSVNAFASEMVLRVNGEIHNDNISFKSVTKGCEYSVHFVGVNIPSVNSGTNVQIEILVPSISAMFDLHIWHH